jgi:hypothetical protein
VYLADIFMMKIFEIQMVESLLELVLKIFQQIGDVLFVE